MGSASFQICFNSWGNVLGEEANCPGGGYVYGGNVYKQR